MKKAIIFGINGQDGFYLQRAFAEKGIETIGISRTGAGGLQGDISNFETVSQLIRTNKPAFAIHLAANSSTRHEVLFENHDTIATGSINLLEAVKKYSPETKVFITGSGVQFQNSGNPIKETDAFEASSPYAVARIQSVYAARYYRTLGVQSFVGYLFHHESPLRKPHHVSKMIAERVAAIAAGSSEKIEVGDLSVKKEWAFAGDITQGIVSLLLQDDIYEATIGTGKAYSISDWLACCFSLIQKDWRDHVVEKGGFKAEYKMLVSDPGTMLKLGWKAETSIEDLAAMMLGKRNLV